MRMIRLLLLIFVLPFINLNAQDIQQLDKKRGFKDYKVGENFVKYKDDFDFERTAENGYNVYRAKQDSILIGHILIEQLNLLVYHKKVHEIRFLLDVKYYDQIKEILVKAYGEPNDRPCEEMELEQGKRVDCFWRGNDMFLWCSLIDYKEYKKIVIGFKDFKMVEKMKKELTQKAAGDL